MKGLVGGCLLMVFLVVSMPLSAPASGIPVIDVAGLAQGVQNLLQMIEQAAQLKEQVETAKRQLETAEKELQQKSSVRGMGGIIGSEYDNDMDVDYEAILRGAGIKPADDYGLNGNVAVLYNDRNRAAAQWQGRSEKFMYQAIARFNELKKLVDKVNAAPDQKDVMDLQARIQSEETLLQNEMLKLKMMQSQAEAEQAMVKQKAVQKILGMMGSDSPRF